MVVIAASQAASCASVEIILLGDTGVPSGRRSQLNPLLGLSWNEALTTRMKVLTLAPLSYKQNTESLRNCYDTLSLRRRSIPVRAS